MHDERLRFRLGRATARSGPDLTGIEVDSPPALGEQHVESIGRQRGAHRVFDAAVIIELVADEIGAETFGPHLERSENPCGTLEIAPCDRHGGEPQLGVQHVLRSTGVPGCSERGPEVLVGLVESTLTTLGGPQTDERERRVGAMAPVPAVRDLEMASSSVELVGMERDVPEVRLADDDVEIAPQLTSDLPAGADRRPCRDVVATPLGDDAPYGVTGHHLLQCAVFEAGADAALRSKIGLVVIA